jgi:hypothetical protein
MPTIPANELALLRPSLEAINTVTITMTTVLMRIAAIILDLTAPHVPSRR